MRLIFDRPPPVWFVGDFNRKFYRNDELRSLFVAWLRLHDIYVRDDRKHMRLEYNDLYGFYKIEVFEYPDVREPNSHLKQILKLVEESGLRYENWGMSTWRWEPESGISSEKKMIRGLSLWIYTGAAPVKKRSCCAMVAR